MIPVKFGSIWLNISREEDENVKVFKQKMPSDDKSSHCLWSGELKNMQKDETSLTNAPNY